MEISRSINNLFCSWLFTVARIRCRTQPVRGGCPRALAPHLDPSTAPRATPLSPPLPQAQPQPSTHSRSTQGSSHHRCFCSSLQTPLFTRAKRKKWLGRGERSRKSNSRLVESWDFWSPVDTCYISRFWAQERAPALPQSPWAAHGFGKWAFPSLPGRDVLDVQYPGTLGCQTPRQGTHSPPQVTHTVQFLGQRHSGSVTGQNKTAQHHSEPGCSCHAQLRSSIALREGFGSLVNTKANKKTKCRAQRSQDMAQPAPTANSTHC